MNQQEFESDVIAFIGGELQSTRAPEGEASRARRRPDGTLTEQTNLFQSGWVDSFGLIFLLATIEEMLGIDIPEERIVMRNFRTVRAIWNAFGATQPARGVPSHAD